MLNRTLCSNATGLGGILNSVHDFLVVVLGGSDLLDSRSMTPWFLPYFMVGRHFTVVLSGSRKGSSFMVNTDCVLNDLKSLFKPFIYFVLGPAFSSH